MVQHWPILCEGNDCYLDLEIMSHTIISCVVCTKFSVVITFLYVININLNAIFCCYSLNEYKVKISSKTVSQSLSQHTKKG